MINEVNHLDLDPKNILVKCKNETVAAALVAFLGQYVVDPKNPAMVPEHHLPPGEPELGDRNV